MREIKFRVKRADNGEWVYGDLIHYRESDYRILIQNCGEWDILEAGDKVVPETVGQFTGLHDKNGKEIYEGDIVNVEMSLAWFELKYVKARDVGIGVIKWDFCSWCIETKFKDSSCAGGYDKRYINFPEAFCHTTNEVIGNIYDNPELLEAHYDRT